MVPPNKPTQSIHPSIQPSDSGLEVRHKKENTTNGYNLSIFFNNFGLGLSSSDFQKSQTRHSNKQETTDHHAIGKARKDKNGFGSGSVLDRF